MSQTEESSRNSGQAEERYSSPLHRYNDEFLHLTVVREVLGLAQQSPASYEESIPLASRLVPTLFDADSITLQSRLDFNATIREYRQIAESESNQSGGQTSVEYVLDRDISRYSNLVANAAHDNRDRLKQKLNQLLKAQRLLSGTVTEDEVIWNDSVNRRSSSIEFANGLGYMIAPLKNGSILRTQVIHRKRSESLLGADVLYELHHPFNDSVRFVAMQYKMWDGEKLVFSRASGLRTQLDKMKVALCDNDFCANPQSNAASLPFRLPHCCAFLRPTDKLQAIDAHMKSSGYHIPLCVAKRCLSETQKGKEQLEKDHVVRESVSSTLFDELFENEMIGSKWIPYSVLRGLYRNIAAEFQTYTFCHAQVMSNPQKLDSWS